jgi:hypothetical protein
MSASTVLAAEYGIRFGIMVKQANGLYDVIEETTCIPLYTMDTGFSFGYTIDKKQSEEDPTAYSVHYLPPTANQSTGRVLRTHTETLIWPKERFKMNFGSEDVPGKYSADIYINGEKYKTVKYRVYLPEEYEKGCSQ